MASLDHGGNTLKRKRRSDLSSITGLFTVAVNARACGIMRGGETAKFSPSLAVSAAPGLRLRFMLACTLIPVTAMMALAEGPSEAAKPDRPIGFDIPVQPLSKALYAFSTATGIEILVDARQAAGRRSAGVKGVLAPRDALEILLVGSNLVPQVLAPGTVALKAEPMAPAAQASGAVVGTDLPYFADVQHAVLQALCSDVQATPGAYRLALKMWIGRSGTVLQSKRLDTTGDEALDRVVDAAIQGLNIGRSPPADLPQPVAVIISPRKPRDMAACPANSRRASVR